jgi:GxxExxY protein
MTTSETKIIYPDLSYAIVGAFFNVHKALGPGFLESIYEMALVEELTERHLKVETQKLINLYYKKKKIGIHKLDIVVEDKVVIELKAVERFCLHHKAQLRSYLKAGGYKLGILVNFSKNKVEYERILIR